MSVHAGCRSIEGMELPLLAFYPTLADEAPAKLGPYDVTIARDAPFGGVPGDRAFPLVVVSHGSGSTPLLFRGLAASLARGGFVVLLPTHPGNHRDDDSLAGTAENLARRPQTLRLALDAAYADATLGPHVAGSAVAVVGHSLGATTALSLAGGRPVAHPRGISHEGRRPIAVDPDPRVRALVLLAPATVWFAEAGSLRGVDLPILMRTGDRDEMTPPFHAAIVRGGVADPDKVDHRVVRNAGHFAFVTPFPSWMVRPGFAPGHDPEGFDREAYQPVLHAEVARFLTG